MLIPFLFHIMSCFLTFIHTNASLYEKGKPYRDNIFNKLCRHLDNECLAHPQPWASPLPIVSPPFECTRHHTSQANVDHMAHRAASVNTELKNTPLFFESPLDLKPTLIASSRGKQQVFDIFITQHPPFLTCTTIFMMRS